MDILKHGRETPKDKHGMVPLYIVSFLFAMFMVAVFWHLTVT